MTEKFLENTIYIFKFGYCGHFLAYPKPTKAFNPWWNQTNQTSFHHLKSYVKYIFIPTLIENDQIVQQSQKIYFLVEDPCSNSFVGNSNNNLPHLEIFPSN